MKRRSKFKAPRGKRRQKPHSAAEHRRLRQKIREVRQVLDGLEQMVDDGDLIFTGTGFKFANRVTGGVHDGEA